MKTIYILLYYGIARWLPSSYSRISIGKSVRYFICKRIFLKCGKNVNIERGASFGSGRNVEIGDNSGIGINSSIPSNIVIGKDVMMGPECMILSPGDAHSFDRIDIPMNRQGKSTKQKTIIEDDVWLGARVIVLPGHSIKKGSIVAAGCVLVKDFPEYSIIGGNPSRIIKSRIKQ